jgi:hypothetical protein
MGAIKIETDGASDLAGTYLWMSRHRGQMVELDRHRRLTFGNPITGARAAIIAVLMQDDRRESTQLGGVVRAISSRTPEEPVRLVFEGRSPGGLARDEAEVMAGEILATISDRVASDESIANVA